jgi:peroxiredoxin
LVGLGDVFNIKYNLIGMKKKVRILIALLLISLVGFLGYKITNTLKAKKEAAVRIQTIPNFSFFNLEGTVYTQKNLPNKPIVFVYFNSECDFCKSEATKIQERLVDFNNIQFVFISFEEVKTISQFAKHYKLDHQENVLFLEDRTATFSQIFDANTIPFILVYDAHKKLLQKFKGATKVDAILEVLE